MAGADLAGMRVLVAGGTAGIGLAIAVAAAAAGAVVRIAGRDAARGAAAAALLGPTGGYLAADITDWRQVEALVGAAAEGMGGLDALVASPPAAHLPELLMNIPLAEIPERVQAGLTPVLLLARAALPVMRAAGGGEMLAVASDAGKLATPGETVIGAQMAGIIQFMRGLAIEGKRDGIRANTITPSLVEGTPLTERLMAEGLFSAKLFAKARKLAHLGPTHPEDLAALAVFLLSPAARLITGQAISVNGGISAA